MNLVVDYMRVALLTATHSPDPSTQNGAALWTPNGCTVACNEFPTLVKCDEAGTRLVSPKKYSFVEHAERNTIFKAANWGYGTRGGHLFAVWAACADCARAIIQAGVTELTRFADDGDYETWNQSIAWGDEMLREAGVTINEVKRTGEYGIALLRSGEELVF